MIGKLLTLYLFVTSITWQTKGQSVPVGTAVLEESLQQAQLLGELDPNISFTIRPLIPDSTFYGKNFNSLFNPNSQERVYKTKSNWFTNNQGLFRLLPFRWDQQYNTHHPYSLNDGAMIPAKGYETMVSGGIFAKFRFLSLQLRPEYVYTRNTDFQGFYKSQSDEVWAGYADIYNYIDLPEKFGNSAYSRLFWGQSCIRISALSFSLGLSSESIWWGPGNRNSMMMSNAAPGFEHLTFNTTKPVKTFMGSFEGQLICGNLENSGILPPDTSRTFKGKKLYLPKRDAQRYINGIILTWQPKWTPGLFLGLTRTFIAYKRDMGKRFSDYLPVITPFTKKANYGEGDSPYANDQRLSLFGRWFLPEEHAEIYGEIYREDHAFDLRDAFIQTYHSLTYQFGLKKIVPFSPENKQFLQVNFELTHLALTTTNPERPEYSIYLHNAGIPQGYTHMGQMLGAAIGPGSNMATLSVTYVKSLKTIGIQLERYVHDNDFQVAVIKDARAKWLDFTTSVTGTYDYQRFLFSARFDLIRSYNYQYLYQPIVSDPPSPRDPGRDIWNLQGKLSVSYNF
jgi:hypothetical protein